MSHDADLHELVDRTPAPIYWCRELEAANHRSGQLPIWCDLDLRSRQRGSSLLASRNWPGSVTIASDVVYAMLQSKTIIAPAAMKHMSEVHQAQFISLLFAWTQQRLYYSFTHLGAQIVINGQVDCPLAEHSFSLLPGAGLYIDMQCHEDENTRMPFGAFAGLDADPDGHQYLVLALDYGQEIEVMHLPLTGHLLHQLLLDHGLGNYAAQLHSVISAIFLCSTCRSGLQDMETNTQTDGAGVIMPGVKAYSISGSFNPSMTAVYDEAVHFEDGMKVNVNAQWIEPTDGSVVNLRLTLNREKELMDDKIVQELLRKFGQSQ